MLSLVLANACGLAATSSCSQGSELCQVVSVGLPSGIMQVFPTTLNIFFLSWIDSFSPQGESRLFLLLWTCHFFSF